MRWSSRRFPQRCCSFFIKTRLLTLGKRTRAVYIKLKSSCTPVNKKLFKIFLHRVCFFNRISILFYALGVFLGLVSSPSRRRRSRKTGSKRRVLSSPICSTTSCIIGVSALSAASLACEPAGLSATNLRRASSQSGRI